MRAGWDTSQTMRAMKGALDFTTQEAVLIRRRLRNIDSPETAPVVMTVLSIEQCRRQ